MKPQDLPRFANIRAPIIAAQRRRTRSALFLLFVFFGMGWGALALTHGYAGAIDSINNPHLEGF